MRKFFRNISPKRAVNDFTDQWSRPTPHRWQILGVACAATFALFMLFIPEEQVGEIPPPDLVYITTFDESRTDAQIITSNCANQRRKDEFRARVEASEEAQREMYEALGRATFMDVDEIREEAEAERAAEETQNEGPTEEELAAALEEYCARGEG